jgi:hypothetical protein
MEAYPFMKTVMLFYEPYFAPHDEKLLGLFTYVVIKNGFLFEVNGNVRNNGSKKVSSKFRVYKI